MAVSSAKDWATTKQPYRAGRVPALVFCGDGVDEIVLLCSGPSAQNIVVPDDVPVGCVNGSFALLDRLPTWWCVGELQATEHYRPQFEIMRDGGVTCLTRQRCIDRSGWKGATPIRYDFGPRYMQPIHDDALGIVPPMPEGHGMPNNVRPWCTSGILLLWWLVDTYHPKRLIVAGMDGYGAQEYAEGIEALPNRPERNRLWVDIQNAKLSECVCMITHCPEYLGTEFWWARMPRFYNTARHRIGLIDPTPLRETV